jgi:glutathione synthase/RimK-type ligase-like ATP-grasp enzyme
MKKYKARIASRHPSHHKIELPMFSRTVRVRFGSQIKHRKRAIDFNSIEAIENTANKMKMKAIFSEAGVNSPRYLSNNDTAKDTIMSGYLGEHLFFKTPYHSRGRGMVIYDNKESAVTQNKQGYFEQAQVSDREFRVHVMDGEVFYVDEKRVREGESHSTVKNMDNGYKFRRPLKDYPPEVESESIKAVLALGLDFGAADVGVNENGTWIYEVNSAASLRTKTRKLYQKALVKLIYKKIMGERKYVVYLNGNPVNSEPLWYLGATAVYHTQNLDLGDVKIVDEVERLSQEYNNWLDQQPLTE